MAIAGDIIIKLAADFAEFAKGMTDSAKLLDDFGKKADGIGKQIEGAFNTIKRAAVVTALVDAVKQVIDEIDRLETKFTGIAEQASKLGTSFNSFEALRVAAMQSGISVDDLTNIMTRLKGVTEQAIQGNAATIQSLNKLGVTILDNNGKLRSQEEINRLLAEAFAKMPPGIEKMRLEYQLLGEAGEATDKKLALLASDISDAAQRIADSGLAKVTEDLKKIEDRSKAAREQWDLLVGHFALEAKAGFLDGWTTGLERLNAAIIAFNLTKLENLMQVLQNPVQSLGKFLLDPDSIKTRLEELDKLADKQKAAMDAAQSNSGGVSSWFKQDAEAARNAYYDTLAEINRIKVAADQLGRGNYPPEGGPGAVPFGKFRDKGSNPPAVGGGGGGGRNDIETIDTLIARYAKMQAAADAATATVRGNTTADVRDLGLVIEAQQAAADAVAKIEARLKTKVPTPLIDALQQQIFLAKEAQAEQQRSLQYAQQAVATQDKLGDSTDGLQHAVHDLNKQWDSGRLSQVAYTRSLKQIEEQQEQVRLQSKRYDDDLGSLAAGFQSAAQAFARSNDLYTQGGQIFTAGMQAMGDGLDALVGKSSKSFEQIAADFALMLAKMALYAALSKIFTTVFGDAFSGGMASAGLPGSPYFGPPNPAAIYTPRAGGGDVYPGQSYTVGEYGPERFVPQAAGRIEPLNGGNGAGTVVINLDMKQAQGARDPSAALEFGRKVKAAVVDVIANEKRPGGSLYSRKTA
jgi:hypothetical protein